MLRWRAALRTAPAVPDVQDQLDWAELCLAVGERDAARLLFATAFICQGYSARLRAAQDRTAERTGLWEPGEEEEPARRTSSWTTDIAIAELERLARTLPAGAAPRLAGVKPPAEYGRPDSVAGLVIVGTPAPPPADIADLAHRLHAFLRAPAPDRRRG